MKPTRVLVVDDAVVVRRIVTDVLAAEPAIEVVGSAPNGRVALDLIPRLAPDLLTLDVEMPEMDGLATLTEVRRLHPRLPVVMFSTLTERGAAVTVEALLRGANDYVTKPANVGSVAEAKQRVREQLVPKIAALCPGGQQPGPRPAATSRPDPPPGRPDRPPGRARPGTARRTPPVSLVVVGVSTGGPNALAGLVPQLPGDLRAPVVVVQHMPPMFTGLLAERLDAQARLRVAEGVDGAEVRPGQLWIAPGDRHLLTVQRGGVTRLRTSAAPPENSCRPAVDVLFRSAAAAHGPGVLAVVLTGMGADGLRGCEHVAAAGGQVVVQDEASSVVWGMPGAVARAGLADAVVGLPAMASEIVRRVTAHQPSARAAAVG